MSQIDAQTCLSLYKLAALIRRTQEVLMEEYVAKQEMRCPMHFCIGQEGTPTALSPLLKAEDYIVSHYRSHGYYLAKGAPLSEMIAEFHGKATGSNGGYAGSMELAHEDAHFYSGAIVGGPISIAMGMAFGIKYNERPGIVIAVSGDGSLDEGITYESLNLAALHEVPLLTICENNLYAAHTAAAERTKSQSLADRVRPFGVDTRKLDGMDVIQLHLQLRSIVEDMRARPKPLFVEVETYRFCGHVGPEDDSWLAYRSAEEIAAWKDKDPVTRLRAEAKRIGVSEPELREIGSGIEAEIKQVLAKARADEFPSLARSLTDVRAETYSPLVKSFARRDGSSFDSRQAETELKSF